MDTAIETDSPHSIAAQFRAGKYDAVIQTCEEAIANGDVQPLYFWYLGMALLLTDQPDLAQALWLDGLMLAAEMANLSDPEAAVPALLEVLHSEIQAARSQNKTDVAWELAQCCLELDPENRDTILDVLSLGIAAQSNSAEAIAPVVAHLISLNPIPASTDESPVEPWTAAQSDRLLSMCESLLIQEPTHPTSVDFAAFCVHGLTIDGDVKNRFAEALYQAARTCYEQSRLSPAIAYADWSIQLDNTAIERISDIVAILRESGAIARPRALELTEHWLAIAPDPVSQLQAIETLLALLGDAAGHDPQVADIYQRYRSHLD
ncbi:MAG: hypothetical protein IGR76_09905, partial [Synechococcales cyanobacterium T60_A2020_003]|nr:hypothetical protein [Synechococcales cyanobacterium T60_A2020_003]